MQALGSTTWDLRNLQQTATPSNTFAGQQRLNQTALSPAQQIPQQPSSCSHLALAGMHPSSALGQQYANCHSQIRDQQIAIPAHLQPQQLQGSPVLTPAPPPSARSTVAEALGPTPALQPQLAAYSAVPPGLSAAPTGNVGPWYVASSTVTPTSVHATVHPASGLPQVPAFTAPGQVPAVAGPPQSQPPTATPLWAQQSGLQSRHVVPPSGSMHELQIQFLQQQQHPLWVAQQPLQPPQPVQLVMQSVQAQPPPAPQLVLQSVHSVQPTQLVMQSAQQWGPPAQPWLGQQLQGQRLHMQNMQSQPPQPPKPPQPPELPVLKAEQQQQQHFEMQPTPLLQHHPVLQPQQRVGWAKRSHTSHSTACSNSSSPASKRQRSTSISQQRQASPWAPSAVVHSNATDTTAQHHAHSSGCNSLHGDSVAAAIKPESASAGQQAAATAGPAGVMCQPVGLLPQQQQHVECHPQQPSRALRQQQDVLVTMQQQHEVNSLGAFVQQPLAAPTTALTNTAAAAAAHAVRWHAGHADGLGADPSLLPLSTQLLSADIVQHRDSDTAAATVVVPSPSPQPPEVLLSSTHADRGEGADTAAAPAVVSPPSPQDPELLLLPSTQANRGETADTAAATASSVAEVGATHTSVADTSPARGLLAAAAAAAAGDGENEKQRKPRFFAAAAPESAPEVPAVADQRAAAAPPADARVLNAESHLDASTATSAATGAPNFAAVVDFNLPAAAAASPAADARTIGTGSPSELDNTQPPMSQLGTGLQQQDCPQQQQQEHQQQLASPDQQRHQQESPDQQQQQQESSDQHQQQQESSDQQQQQQEPPDQQQQQQQQESYDQQQVGSPDQRQQQQQEVAPDRHQQQQPIVQQTGFVVQQVLPMSRPAAIVSQCFAAAPDTSTPEISTFANPAAAALAAAFTGAVQVAGNATTPSAAADLCCANCGVTHSKPQWRRDCSNPTRRLCNNCGSYKAHHGRDRPSMLFNRSGTCVNCGATEACRWLRDNCDPSRRLCAACGQYKVRSGVDRPSSLFAASISSKSATGATEQQIYAAPGTRGPCAHRGVAAKPGAVLAATAAAAVSGEAAAAAICDEAAAAAGAAAAAESDPAATAAAAAAPQQQIAAVPDTNRLCAHCGVTSSRPQWRRDSSDPSRRLCNACWTYKFTYGRERPTALFAASNNGSRAGAAATEQQIGGIPGAAELCAHQDAADKPGTVVAATATAAATCGEEASASGTCYEAAAAAAPESDPAVAAAAAAAAIQQQTGVAPGTNRQCANCGVAEGRPWRRDSSDRSRWLCDACGKYKLRSGKDRPSRLFAASNVSKSGAAAEAALVTTQPSGTVAAGAFCSQHTTPPAAITGQNGPSDLVAAARYGSTTPGAYAAADNAADCTAAAIAAGSACQHPSGSQHSGAQLQQQQQQQQLQHTCQQQRTCALPSDDRSCANCGVTESSCWRRDRSDPSRLLCNACGKYRDRHRKDRPSALFAVNGGDRLCSASASAVVRATDTASRVPTSGTVAESAACNQHALDAAAAASLVSPPPPPAAAAAEAEAALERVPVNQRAAGVGHPLPVSRAAANASVESYRAGHDTQQQQQEEAEDASVAAAFTAGIWHSWEQQHLRRQQHQKPQWINSWCSIGNPSGTEHSHGSAAAAPAAAEGGGGCDCIASAAAMLQEERTQQQQQQEVPMQLQSRQLLHKQPILSQRRKLAVPVSVVAEAMAAAAAAAKTHKSVLAPENMAVVTAGTVPACKTAVAATTDDAAPGPEEASGGARAQQTTATVTAEVLAAAGIPATAAQSVYTPAATSDIAMSAIAAMQTNPTGSVAIAVIRAAAGGRPVTESPSMPSASAESPDAPAAAPGALVAHRTPASDPGTTALPADPAGLVAAAKVLTAGGMSATESTRMPTASTEPSGAAQPATREASASPDTLEAMMLPTDLRAAATAAEGLVASSIWSVSEHKRIPAALMHTSYALVPPTAPITATPAAILAEGVDLSPAASWQMPQLPPSEHKRHRTSMGEQPLAMTGAGATVLAHRQQPTDCNQHQCRHTNQQQPSLLSCRKSHAVVSNETIYGTATAAAPASNESVSGLNTKTPASSHHRDGSKAPKLAAAVKGVGQGLSDDAVVTPDLTHGSRDVTGILAADSPSLAKNRKPRDLFSFGDSKVAGSPAAMRAEVLSSNVHMLPSATETEDGDLLLFDGRVRLSEQLATYPWEHHGVNFWVYQRQPKMRDLRGDLL